MKLWLLTAKENLAGDNDPWISRYDCYYGFVIRAETETEARQIADNGGADEKRFGIQDTWLNPAYSNCVEVTAAVEAGIVLRDFNAG